MFSKIFASACVAGTALTMRLNSHGSGSSSGFGSNFGSGSGSGGDQGDVGTESEWQDSNICITYGEDNSVSQGTSSCDSDCSTPVSSDTVTYRSQEETIRGISALSPNSGSSTLTVAGATKYEILGSGCTATLRQTINVTHTTTQALADTDKIYWYAVYLDSAGMLCAYLYKFEFDGSRYTWQRFVNVGAGFPNFDVSTGPPDFAASGFTLKHTDTFAMGDSVVVTTPAGATDGYHLQIEGTGDAPPPVNEARSFRVIKDSDNDELAIVAGGVVIDAEIGIILDDTGASVAGASTNSAELVFPAQTGTSYSCKACCC